MGKIGDRKDEFNENMEILKRTYADMKIKMKNNSTKNQWEDLSTVWIIQKTKYQDLKTSRTLGSSMKLNLEISKSTNHGHRRRIPGERQNRSSTDSQKFTQTKAGDALPDARGIQNTKQTGPAKKFSTQLQANR